MLLLNGVSGFFMESSQSKIIDVKQVKTEFYNIVKQSGGSAVNFEDKQHQSFYQGDIYIQNKKVYVLFNRQYPFIALASKADSFDIDFLSEKNLPFQSFTDTRLLTPEELNTPLVIRQKKNRLQLENENDLNEVELSLIKYWDPKTVGEIIFNHWD